MGVVIKADKDWRLKLQYIAIVTFSSRSCDLDLGSMTYKYELAVSPGDVPDVRTFYVKSFDSYCILQLANACISYSRSLPVT